MDFSTTSLESAVDAAQCFLFQVKARSTENATSFNLLHASGKYSMCIVLLRLELDSLLRLCYLWRPETSANEARLLMQDSAQNNEWKHRNAKGKLVKLRESDMLRLASFLGGWEKVVYNFGCKAVHLSSLHAYQTRDPLALASAALKEEIIGYLKFYHGYGKQMICMDDLYTYLPRVMEKLTDNVAFYVEELEERYAKRAE